ncbi:hypothetical protein GGX14DRAFT_580576 [Mycena pura]|uniref:Uncharacterized protein n=1 Tax=Mycena pura TaxID=153505 RepID=A0AAD6UPP3_9AGAR|nr:hypothetical protein GGX14DRAFT_580576 [Mycena pura]
MNELVEIRAIVLFVFLAFCSLAFLMVLPTVIIACIPGEVLLWLVKKYLLLLSGTAVFIATTMLWLLLCDARRWLVGASAESDIERGTTSTTAALEHDKASARPAPGDTTAGENASTTATAPGPFEDLTSTVIGKIITLAIFTTLVLGDLWLFGIVSRTKPARENIAAALMHELAGLEALCVLTSILAVFAVGAQTCGCAGAMENEGESGRRRRRSRAKGIEAQKQSQEMHDQLTLPKYNRVCIPLAS